MVPRQSNERRLGRMIRIVAPCPSLRAGGPSRGAIAVRSAVRLSLATMLAQTSVMRAYVCRYTRL
jgi:hypothetical protein